MWSTKSLSEKTVSELKEIAKSREIKGYYKMRKNELIQSLTSEFIKEIDPTSMERIRKMLRGEPRIFELRKIAKKMGISFKRNMKKTELEDRIKRSLIRHERAEQAQGSSNISGAGSNQRQINPEEPVIPELPKSYKRDKLVALPVNPLWIHIYWDFSNQTDELITRLRDKGKTVHLRIYDVTYIDFNGENAHQIWENDISTDSERKFYANVNNPNASYLTEIGYINENGEFVTILRSNLVKTPPNTFSSKKEEKWLDLSSGYKFSKSAQGILSKPTLKAVGGSSFFPHEFNKHAITSGGGSFLNFMTGHTTNREEGE
ncbi:MAG: DUF4912 domain-containing protein [Thermotogota bacterium]